MLQYANHKIVHGKNKVAEPGTLVDLDDEIVEELTNQGAVRDPTEAERKLHEAMKPMPGPTVRVPSGSKLGANGGKNPDGKEGSTDEDNIG